MLGVHQVAVSFTPSSRGMLHGTPNNCPVVMQSVWWGIKAWTLAQRHLIPLPSLHGKERSSFLVLVPSSDTVKLITMVGIRHGDSSVVIRSQAAECTLIWLKECFIAQLHIYLGFMGKVSIYTHWPLESEYENYSSLDQAVTDFEDKFVLYSLTVKITRTACILWWA